MKTEVAKVESLKLSTSIEDISADGAELSEEQLRLVGGARMPLSPILCTAVNGQCDPIRE